MTLTKVRCSPIYDKYRVSSLADVTARSRVPAAKTKISDEPGRVGERLGTAA